MASGLSNAFSGCSGLAGILDGLEGGGPPTERPCAIKRRKLAAPKKALAPRAKVVSSAPPAVPAVAVPTIAHAVPAGGPAPTSLSDTRKCVHSRAYKKAANLAKAAGLSKAEISTAACKAGKEAADKWEEDHA